MSAWQTRPEANTFQNVKIREVAQSHNQITKGKRHKHGNSSINSKKTSKIPFIIICVLIILIAAIVYYLMNQIKANSQ